MMAKRVLFIIKLSWLIRTQVQEKPKNYDSYCNVSTIANLSRSESALHRSLEMQLIQTRRYYPNYNEILQIL
jgi:hypothetical protein